MKRIVAADLSNIEGRGLAFLAGEKWKLEAFRAYDRGEGPDLYNITATSIIGGDPYEVAKKNRNVFGKVPDLACFAPDTLVLTDSGHKRIVEVLLTDKLWDGVEWVKHEGLIERGVSPVVNVDGISVTLDHLILIGKTWKRAQLLASSARYLSLALATGSENLPSLSLREAPRADYAESLYAAHAARHHTAPSSLISVAERLRGVINALKINLRSGERTTTGMPTSYRTTPTDDACSIESPLALTGAATRMTPRMRTTVGAEFTFTPRGSRTAKNILNTLLPLTGGTFPSWSLTALMWTKAMGRVILGSSQDKRIGGISGPSGNCRRGSPNLSPVYDIALVGPRNRFTVVTNSGHLIAHNCGYEGGVGALQTFANAYGVRMRDHWDTILESTDASHVASAKANYAKWGYEKVLDMEIIEEEWIASETVKLAWRARHPATRELWKDTKNAVVNAIQNPGEIFKAGKYLKFSVRRKGGHPYLLVKLPSGRYLTYFHPKLEGEGYDMKISYMGDYRRTPAAPPIWGKVFTYGGKLVENFTQAFARDVMAYSMPAAEEAGYAITLTIHDEMVTESDGGTAEELSAIMATVPPWAKGLPLAAAGFVADRYKKD